MIWKGERIAWQQNLLRTLGCIGVQGPEMTVENVNLNKIGEKSA